MRLVKDWRKAWKWLSVQLAAMGVLITSALIIAPQTVLMAWAMLPDALREELGDWKKQIAAAVFLMAIVARLIDQAPKDKP